jgi:2,4-dienoyl-CoA reductase-like NADH-dependent reductase (Old Yellow Enzyme family)/thioredoxin reductase
MTTFEHLFSPLRIRGCEIKNRIFSTGHQTWLACDGNPGEDLAAYHEARAAGGAGLIVTEAARVHDSALSDVPEIDASRDDCIPGYRAIGKAAQRHGCRVFGQLSHPGRVSRLLSRGLRKVAYSASSVPDHRFHTMPRAMPLDMVREIVDSYGAAARRLAEAGLDGVEISASHGGLPAQFLNAETNRRDDAYGGPLPNRMRFLLEAIASVRAAVGEEVVVGIRISAEEAEPGGLDLETMSEVCRALEACAALDYINTTMGSMAGLGGSVHVVPPMELEPGYVAPRAAAIRAVTTKPVFVAGRINQPQVAEDILARGQADMCGMTRALITDPDLPAKARAGRLDDIRACIGCNQACIGHFHLGHPISCIQNPVAGRERALSRPPAARSRRRILVAGGGPGGMKAAATAAERGHEVVLCEASGRLGGQVCLAQLLPERAEFGGLITNLERELANAGVIVRKNTLATRVLVEELAPDAVVVATGARPYRPPIEGEEEAHLVDAWQVLLGEANPGARVLVADWRCDWIGMGLAEKLARDGCHVRLAVNGTQAGQNLQPYLRDHWVGKLSRLGVEVIPYARLFGTDADTAYLIHDVTHEAVVCEGVDTVVLALGHEALTDLERELAGCDLEIHLAGDCLSPRSAEEAVYEGMLAGLAV